MKENLKEKVKVKDILNNKLLKKGALTGLIVLAILIIFVVINRSIYFLNVAPADFTDDKIYSLTDKSKDLIKEIEQNVNVYVFGYSENSTVGILAKQYHDLNNKINVQFVSTNSRVDLAQEYNVSTADSLIAIESSQRYKAIDKSELYTYDAVDKTYYDLTEQKITNAILEVTYPEPSNVYFLTGHGEYSISDENEFLTLAKAIVNNVKNFILKFGKDFAFIRNQYHLDAFGEDQYVDLLFFNRALNCLVAVELKTGEFKTSYLGQLQGYLSIIDGFEKKPHENPAIGLILCADMNKPFVDYVIQDFTSPMGVATYKTSKDMSEELRKALPDIEDLKRLLGSNGEM